MRRLMVLSLLLAALGACSLFGPPDERFAIFFEEWSASLNEGGNQAVAQAAALARRYPDTPVIVTGYADPEGSPQANRDLSRTRAQVVADRLVADGVQRQRITVRAGGEIGYAMDPQESRRVTIRFGTP